MIRSNKKRALLKFGAALGLALPLTMQPSWADADAAKGPTRIIVAFSAGGYTDVLGRVLAEQLSKDLGRNFIVENKAGANGVIGTVSVARARNDGTTLLLAAPGHVTNPLLLKDPPYDSLKDFSLIIKVATLPNVLVVPANSPYKSVQDIIQAATAKPGEITYGSGGIGSSNHLAMEHLAKMSRISLRHVPYKGSSLAETDVAGGHVEMMFSGAGSAVTKVQSGTLRALGVSGKTPLASLPGVPTVDSAGVPGYEFSSWLGLFAPAGTPTEVVEKLNAAVNKAMQNTSLSERLNSLGVDAFKPNSTQEFTAFLKEEIETQRALVADMENIKQ